MKKTFNFKMVLLAFLGVQISLSNAQTTLFEEDFEDSTITTFLNDGFGGPYTIPTGGSACGFTSRGNSTIFNTSGVDFKNAQNGTYYLGGNPEAPCGGVYNATVLGDTTLDLSGTVDSLVFECRYFKDTLLAWGIPTIDITFDDPGTASYTINNAAFGMPAGGWGNWATLRVKLPSSIAVADVDMDIIFGINDGVAIDDIRILSYSASTTVLATSVTVAGKDGASIINSIGGTLEMEATILPANTSDKSVVWSVVDGTGSATIGLNGLLTAVTAGTVTVRATNAASGLFGEEVVTITTVSGINNRSDLHVKLFPNPVKDYLDITSTDLAIEKVAIYNLSGEKIEMYSSTSDFVRVNMSDFEKGFYMVNVTFTNGESIVEKIVK